MVTSLNSARTDNTKLDGPPLVVELVGPAGAGKTTLSRALGKRNKRILAGVRLRRIGHILFFISSTLFLLPTYLRQHRHSRWFTREETRAMTYLKAWHHALGRQASSDIAVTVLDHGPVFRLAQLCEFGPEITRSRRFEEWWDRMLKQCTVTLDMVIWLDAPDTNLLERIHVRDRWHIIKGKSEQEGYEFLARYRRSFERVIPKLTANGGPRVLRFDTNQESLDQIVDKVLAHLACWPQ